MDVLTVTLAFINDWFAYKAMEPPFAATKLDDLRRTSTSLYKGAHGTEEYQQTELHLRLRMFVSEKLGEARFNVLSKILFCLSIKDLETLGMLELPLLRQEVNQYIIDNKMTVVQMQLAEAAIFAKAGLKVTPAAMSTSSLRQPLATGYTLADNVQYTEQTIEAPLSASINTVRGILELLQTTTGTDPFTLMAAMKSDVSLDHTVLLTLEQILTTNILVDNVNKHIQMNTRMESTSLDKFGLFLEFTCQFRLRQVFTRLRSHLEPGRYGGMNVRDALMANAEDKLVQRAFAHIQERMSTLTMLDDLITTFPAMETCIQSIYQLPANTPIDEIKDRLTKRFDTLRADERQSNDQAIFHLDSEESTILRIDSGADSSVMTPTLMTDKQDSVQTWQTMGGSFRTQTTGKLTGQVQGTYKKRGENNKFEYTDATLPITVTGVGTDRCVTNLLSPEDLIDDSQWEAVGLRLTPTGEGSYLYGKDNYRVPLIRIPGKKGYHLKIFNQQCKSSLICSGVFTLIEVDIGGSGWKNITDPTTYSDASLILNKNKITIDPYHEPYTPEEILSDLELDLYAQRECKQGCQPDRIQPVKWNSPGRWRKIDSTNNSALKVQPVSKGDGKETTHEKAGNTTKPSKRRQRQRKAKKPLVSAGKNTTQDRKEVTTTKTPRRRKRHRKNKQPPVPAEEKTTQDRTDLNETGVSAENNKTSDRMDLVVDGKTVSQDKSGNTTKSTKRSKRQRAAKKTLGPGGEQITEASMEPVGQCKTHPSGDAVAPATRERSDFQYGYYSILSDMNDECAKETDMPLGNPLEINIISDLANDQTEEPTRHKGGTEAPTTINSGGVQDNNRCDHATEAEEKGKGSIHLTEDMDMLNAHQHTQLLKENTSENIMQEVTTVLNEILDHVAENLETEELSDTLRLPVNYFARARHTYRKPDKVTISNAKELFHLHEVYNHRSLATLRTMFRIKLPRRYTSFKCNACDASKMFYESAPDTYQRDGIKGRQVKVGEEWHCDLAFIPAQHSHRHGNIILTRVDAMSKEGDTVVMRSKPDTLDGLKKMVARAGKPPSIIKVDRGMEFLDIKVQNYCRDTWNTVIVPSGASSHRGIAERFNRTIKESMLSVLLGRQVPLRFWPEALSHVVYVYNHTVHASLHDQTPASIARGYTTDSWNLHGVFGCLVKVLQAPEKKKPSLTTKYRCGVFLGIDPHSSFGTYRVLMLDTKRMTYPSRGIRFEPDLAGFTVSQQTSTPPSHNTDLERLILEKSQTGHRTDRPNPHLEGIEQIQTGGSQHHGRFTDRGARTPIVATGSEAVEQSAECSHTELADVVSTTNAKPPIRRSTRVHKTPENFMKQYEDIYLTPQLSSSTPSVHHVTKDNCTEDTTTKDVGYDELHTFLCTEGNTTLNNKGEIHLMEEDHQAVHAKHQDRIKELRELVKRNPQAEKITGPPPKKWKTVRQALQDDNPFKAQVLAAMELEILTLFTKGTFAIQPDKKWARNAKCAPRLGTKWVITSKDHVIKARLVVLGYMQEVRGRYLYAPTTKKDSLRQLYGKSARYGTPTRSLDIRNAFIRESCTGEVFIFVPYLMEQFLTEDFTDVQRIKLMMMLYGMRESPLAFYNGLVKHLESIGFRRSYSDPCHFRRPGIDVVFHVDDATYTGTPESMEQFEKQMAEYYELKDLGPCELFVGIRILNTDQGVFLHQVPYINHLVETYLDKEVTYKGKAQTPMQTKLQLPLPVKGAKTAPECAHLPFKELRSSLNFVASATRPDITLALSVLAAYDYCYTTEIYRHLLHVLKYLEATKYRSIRYSRTSGSEEIQSFMARGGDGKTPPTSLSADASSFTRETDYAGRGGYLLMCQGGPISWSAHKLRGASLGSYDAEFKNLSHACMNNARLQDSLIEFDLLTPQDRLPVFCDNTTAIKTLQRPPGSSTKCGHIEKHYFFAQDKIKTRMKLHHIHTEHMLADILTKPLGPNIFIKLRDQIVYEIPEEYRSELMDKVDLMAEEEMKSYNLLQRIDCDANDQEHHVIDCVLSSTIVGGDIDY